MTHPDDLTFDGSPLIVDSICDCCGTPRQSVTGFIKREDIGAYAIYSAGLYHPEGDRDVYLDVIFGTFGVDDPSDHVTFGTWCRDAPEESGCMLVTAAASAPREQSIYGCRLTREEALEHPLLPEFWRVVDFVLTNDMAVNRHHYGERQIR